jgi:hypothetical protein
MQPDLARLRTRWAAIGAAVAITLGAGGIGVTHATLSSGERTSFVPITPCRLVDTRPGDDNVGDRSTPLGAGQSITLEVRGPRGECNLTAGPTGVSLNVTALNASQPTYLTLYPTGGELPTASHLNPAPGQPPTPNAVEVDVNDLGQFNVFNGFGAVDIIIDVVGYYEDHNHDDRYYTEGETDQAIAEAKTAAVHVGGDSSVSNITGATIVRTAVLNAPTSGTIYANAATTILFAGTSSEAACALSPDGTRLSAFSQFAGRPTGTTIANISALREFDAAPGSNTVNLVCQSSQGGSSITVLRPHITLVFIPD